MNDRSATGQTAAVICCVVASFILSGIAQAQISAPQNPRSAKACAICHYRWIDTFFIDGRGTELVPYQSEKVVATPDMCFSCHDGSIMDSRDRMLNGAGHKTNVPPPADMMVPEIFPLDEKGRVQCATCHTAHGVPSGTGEETTIFMRTSNKDSAMCRMCHPAMEGGTVAGNHPIGPVRRPNPQALLALSAAAGKPRKIITCEICHTAHGSPYENYLILSGRDASLCTACHQDKRTLDPAGRKQPNHVVNVQPVNAVISDEMLERGARLGGQGQIICQTCHKVHRNQIENDLLLIDTDAGSTLCLKCHLDKQLTFDTKHNLAHTAPGVKNLKGQTVAEAGVCSACHLPHGPARVAAGADDFTSRMCMSCHGKEKIAASERLLGVSHPVDIDPFEEKAAGKAFKAVDAGKDQLDLPLFSPAGVQDKDGKMTCTTCHNPHRWRADTDTGEIRKDAAGDRKTSFLRRSSPEICRDCHAQKFYLQDTKHDLALKAPQSNNLLDERPAVAGLCGSCHLVHGGGPYYLWARPIAAKDRPDTQTLCRSCHNPDGPAREKLVGDHSHPKNIAPSDSGMQTQLPLFGPSADRRPTGRMSCPTCHDPHRWDPDDIPAGAHHQVEGNSRNSFLRLKNAPVPELCVACHKDAVALSGTDHDLQITAPGSTNNGGQKPADSGPCGVCHMVHNSEHEFLLWARDLGTGYNLMDRLCRQCHSDKGSAADKVPLIATHPQDVAINNAGRNTEGRPAFFPLYEAITGERIRSGPISCASCHDVHHWSPLYEVKRTGTNLEGNAATSFLRNASYNTICADCHGQDALVRYLYFHMPDKRYGTGTDNRQQIQGAR